MSNFVKTLILVLISLFYICCSSISNSGDKLTENKTTDINLQNALKMATIDIKARVPQNSIIAIVNFDTTSENLSNYLIDEITNLLLLETQLKIVERRQLEIIQEELNFQMSGAVSDETAKSIGKFIGADTIITGTFFIIANKYRLGIKSIHVETGIVQSLYIANVNIDNELSLIVRSTSTINSNIQQNRQTSNAVNISQPIRINSWNINSIISPDGKWVISMSSNPRHTINIYDILDGQLLRSISVPNPYSILYESLGISMDGRIIAISYGESDYNGNTFGHILFYDVLTGRQVQNSRVSGGRLWRCRCIILYNPARNHLVAAVGNRIHLLNFETGNKRETSIITNINGINTINFSNDGSLLAVGNWDGNISVLEASTLRLIYTLKGHKEAINSLAFSPDNKILLSGSRDFTIGVWDLSNGKELFTLTEHFGEINTVLFSLDGNIFISSSEDRTVKLWSTNTYSVIRNITRPQFWPSKLSLTPDGNYFITQGGYLYKIE